MKLELFYAKGCEQCASGREKLKQTAMEADPELQWIELDVMDNLDYAVELGVLTLPALAIDGSLTFTSLPTPKQLIDAMGHQRSVGKALT